MQSLFKQAAATLLAGAACFATGAAHADTTWAWSYTGNGVSAAGTLVTAGSALVPEGILSITGSRNGETILGLVPLDTDANFVYDNQFTIADPHFSDGGLLFDIGGGDIGHINLYYFEGQYFDLQVDADAGIAYEVPISFSVSAVPEPSTYACLALGLVGVAAVLRRRRTQV